jgi:hypothetical protein
MFGSSMAVGAELNQHVTHVLKSAGFSDHGVTLNPHAALHVHHDTQTDIAYSAAWVILLRSSHHHHQLLWQHQQVPPWPWLPSSKYQLQC